MNNTRILNSVVVLSVAIVAITLLSLGFAAWSKLPEAGIRFGGLNLSQGSGPEPVTLLSSTVNEKGLAIYRRSERGVTLSPINAEGMALYHESEWGSHPAVQSNAAGLEIYRLSERSSARPAAPGSIEEGTAIYLQSERSLVATDPVASVDEGMAIYHASEWGR